MSDVVYPMPAGVEKMTKEELWQWFARCQHAAKVQNTSDKTLFTMTTALHPSYWQYRNTPWNIIDLQAKRIRGLELQMAQMQKGYKKKFEKLKRQTEQKGENHE